MEEPGRSKVAKRWNKANHLCKCYILNSLASQFYDVYASFKNARETWEVMKKKYVIEDVGIKLFAADTLFDFQMVEDECLFPNLQLSRLDQ